MYASSEINRRLQFAKAASSSFRASVNICKPGTTPKQYIGDDKRATHHNGIHVLSRQYVLLGLSACGLSKTGNEIMLACT